MKKLFEYLRYDLPQVMRPHAFHGAGKSGPFFEGWYYKIVSADGAHRYSIIPGIYIGEDHADDHAFVQVIDGVSGFSTFIPYPFEEFHFVENEMDVRIAGSHFTYDHISLNLESTDIQLSGEISIHGQSPWPVTVLSPGVMGWYAWAPGMECYHGIVSMDHALHGELTINGEQIDFSGGRGYLEKDWGRAMPSAWIWMQSNHFSQEGTSFTFSIADIPFGRISFTGFLGGILYDGELHRFATYTGAKIKNLSVDQEVLQFTVADHRKRLEITAHRRQGSVLQAPTLQQMDRRIMETLSAEIDVVFQERSGKAWRTVFTGKGLHAGLEVVGNLAAIRGAN